MLFVFPGLVHVGDELREVNGNLITHKRPDEISQILVREEAFSCGIISSDAVIIHQWLLWIQRIRIMLCCFSVPVTRLHHPENHPSCCRRWQTEGKQGKNFESKCRVYFRKRVFLFNWLILFLIICRMRIVLSFLMNDCQDIFSGNSRINLSIRVCAVYTISIHF